MGIEAKLAVSERSGGSALDVSFRRYLSALSRAQRAPYFVTAEDDGMVDSEAGRVGAAGGSASTRRRHSSRVPPPDPNLQARVCTNYTLSVCAAVCEHTCGVV